MDLEYSFVPKVYELSELKTEPDGRLYYRNKRRQKKYVCVICKKNILLARNAHYCRKCRKKRDREREVIKYEIRKSKNNKSKK